MPFKSSKQKRWMFANKPEMAKKWMEEEKNGATDKRTPKFNARFLKKLKKEKEKGR